MSRVHYLSLLDFDDDWLAELRRRVPDVDVRQHSADKAADIPNSLWASVDVLHTSTVLPDPSVATRLRWVQLDTSGTDHVRDHALWNAQVEVITIGGVSPGPLAEYVLFAVLGMAHRLPAMLALRDSRTWPTPAQRWAQFMPAPLAGATLTILGYGRIGRQIARLAAPLGMSVVGLNRSGSALPEEHLAAQMKFGRQEPEVPTDTTTIAPVRRLAEIAESTDYLVVVCPLTDETRGLVDADIIGRLRPGAVVVNAARGGIVDEVALRSALRSGALSGAVLDVFDREPLPPDDPWWTEPAVLVTPHAAGLAPRYAEHVLDLVAENLRRHVAGEPLLNRVRPGRGY